MFLAFWLFCRRCVSCSFAGDGTQKSRRHQRTNQITIQYKKINEATQRNITNSTTKTRRSNNEKQKQTDQDNQQKTQTNERSVQRQTNQQYDKNHRTNLGKTAGFSSRYGLHFASSLGSILHDFVDLGYTLGGFWDQERRFRPFCRFGVHLGWITRHGTGPGAP